ncbi:hypothetical protein A2379_00730 [Candidatus Amesbacteria bacterium RIFOXYB1_FULL_47_13]|nr:MAG: hypothetical protein A2379_00730 [Candidatus Amesbacteria bacterium RIFOXYB1_FULL_47_13]
MLLTAGLVWFGFSFWKNTKSSAPQYQTAKAEKGTLISSVSASGSVTTSNVQEVTTQATGVVQKMDVEDGQKVAKGQIIAQIELDLVGQQRNAAAYTSLINAQKSVNSANNNYRSTQASLQVVYDEIKGHDTDETLVMKEKRTKAEVANDNAYDGVVSARAQLASSALSYNLTSPVIRAPLSGIINLSVAEGSQISAGSSSDASNQRLATITTEGTPLISVNISEIDALQIKTNQKTNVTFDSLEGKTYTGKVVAMDKLGTSTSNVVTYTALIKLDTGSSEVLPNMVANVNIITDIKTDVLSVPSSAVQTSDSQTSVQILKNGEITNVLVETGSSNGSQTEIVSGINEGDAVVTSTITSDTTGGSQGSSSSPFSGVGRSGRIFQVGGSGGF